MGHCPPQGVLLISIYHLAKILTILNLEQKMHFFTVVVNNIIDIGLWNDT